MMHNRFFLPFTSRLRMLSLATATGIALTGGLVLTAVPGQAGPFSPVVIVNDRAVTEFEINQRLRFMQILNAPDATPDAVREELISERLKLDAARQLGIEVSDENMVEGLAEFAGRANMSTDEFVQALAGEGVEAETYRDFVRAGLAWREVIRLRVVPTVSISEAEVERRLEQILDTPNVTDVLISELIIPAEPGQEGAAMARAEQLSASITSEAGFASAARQYSASPSADSGGRLEWLRVADLPEGLDSILAALDPGEMTPPLQIPGAVVLFYLRDTRGVLRPGAKDEQVDYLTLTVDSAATAASILADATSCDTLYAAAGNAAGAVQRQTVASNALPMGVGARMNSLDDDEGTVIDLGNSAQILMLCKRQRQLIAQASGGNPLDDALSDQIEDGAAVAESDSAEGNDDDGSGLPSRQAVESAVFNERVSDAADAYLAELRANAIIRRP